MKIPPSPCCSRTAEEYLAGSTAQLQAQSLVLRNSIDATLDPMTLQRLIASEVRRKAKRCDSAQAIPPRVRWSSKWTRFPSFEQDGASAGMNKAPGSPEKQKENTCLVFEIYL